MADPRDALESTTPMGLTKAEAQIAYLTVYGLPQPRTLEQAAKDCGYRIKRARNYLDALPAFNEYRRRLLKERRESEQARNLATLIQIRDDPGDGKAADRTVQLKAIQVMEGTPDKASVTVNVNQQNNSIGTISPGYVIRLSASRPEGAPAIEHDRAE
jgi:hypothetical protein